MLQLLVTFTPALLLTDLFGLNSSRVLSTEAELRNCYIVQDDVEVFGSLEQLSSDQQGDLVGTILNVADDPLPGLHKPSPQSRYLSSLCDEL